MTDNYKDTYEAETELKGLDENGKHPKETIIFSKLSHEDFMDVKRNPQIKELVGKLTALAAKMKDIPKDVAPTEEQVGQLIDSMSITGELLETAAILVVKRQFPDLLSRVSAAGGGLLLSAVIDNDLKEAFGMGEAIAALEALTEPKQEPSPSTTTSSTLSA
jgi:hypothetical protein